MKVLWNDWNYENDVEMTEIEADLFDNQSIKSEVTEINKASVLELQNFAGFSETDGASNFAPKS